MNAARGRQPAGRDAPRKAIGRPPLHGARWLAVRLDRNRLTPRIRRALNDLQRELHGNTWETLRGLILGRLARRELLIQQREAHLLADPSAEGGKWLLGMWAAQRRDVEMLGLLERLDAGEKLPTLDAYLHARATPTVVPEGPVAPSSAGTAAQCADEDAP